MQVQSSPEDPLEKGMATHSSVLACKIPWAERPGRLQSMGLQSQTRLSVSTCTHTPPYSISHTRLDCSRRPPGQASDAPSPARDCHSGPTLTTPDAPLVSHLSAKLWITYLLLY